MEVTPKVDCSACIAAFSKVSELKGLTSVCMLTASGADFTQFRNVCAIMGVLNQMGIYPTNMTQFYKEVSNLRALPPETKDPS